MGTGLAAKRWASVAPEVDLGECTLHSPSQKANKAEPTLAWNPKGEVTRNPIQGYQWPPKKEMCVRQKLLKKKILRSNFLRTLMLGDTFVSTYFFVEPKANIKVFESLMNGAISCFIFLAHLSCMSKTVNSKSNEVEIRKTT